MSDRVISPISAAVSVVAGTVSNNFVSTASLAAGMMFTNLGGTAVYCGICSASASAGDLTGASPLAGIGNCLFIGFSNTTPYAYVSGGSAVIAQLVNFLK